MKFSPSSVHNSPLKWLPALAMTALVASSAPRLGAADPGPAKTTFSHTGANQTYTVPAGVTEVYVKAWGAGGGSAPLIDGNFSTSRFGGNGAFVSGYLPVTGGEGLRVVVGGGGTPNRTGGFGGGGTGGAERQGGSTTPAQGAGGGGRSAIQRVIGTDLLAAGGGGGNGGGSLSSGGGGPPSFSGNPGGDAGLSSGSSWGRGEDGIGGTQTGGGAGGSGSNYDSGAAGSKSNGGNGATSSGFSGSSSGGGGGGGGWFGGGGGAAVTMGFSFSSGGGGGGGSSLTTGFSTLGKTWNGSALSSSWRDADYANSAGLGGSGGASGGHGRIVIYPITAATPDISAHNGGTGSDPEITSEQATRISFGATTVGSPVTRSITLRNANANASSVLTISSFAFENGTFEIVSPPAVPATISGGQTLTLQVRFRALSNGTANNELRILTDDPDETMFYIPLTASAVAVPEIAVEQPAGANLTDGSSTIDFGARTVGNQGSLVFTLKNTGSAALTGLSATVAGTHSADFTISPGLPASVAAGGTTTLTVNFSPSAAGARGATLSIASNDADENPFDILLTGAGAAVGSAEVISNHFTGNSGTLPAGWIDIGGDTDPASTIVESGTTATITDTRGAGGPQFMLSPLFDAGGFTVAVNLAAITSVSGSEPEVILGIGSLATSEVLMLSFKSASKTFSVIKMLNGAVSGFVELPSAPHLPSYTGGPLYYVLSAGATSFRVSSTTDNYNSGEIPYTALGAPGFDSIDDFGTTFGMILGVEAGGSVPEGTLGSAAFDRVQVFALPVPPAGAPEIAIEQGKAIADGADKPIADTAIGASSSLTFTVKNTGTAALNLGAITIDGADAADYAIFAAPSTPVAAGGSTTFTLTFTPSAEGNRKATLHLPNNDADENPYDIGLTGRGVSPDPEIVIEQPAGTEIADGGEAAFGSVARETSGSPVTFTIKNASTGKLTLGAITKGGTNPGDFSVSALGSSVLSAGATTTFTVTFSPGAAGARSAVIQIPNNDADENPYDITLTGTGLPSSTALLASLTLSSGTLNPSFIPVTTSYAATVPTDTESLTFTASLISPNSTLIAAGAPLANGGTTAPIPLAVGVNTITAKVTAEDGVTTTTYTLAITREAPLSGAVLASNFGQAAIGGFSLGGTDQYTAFDFTTGSAASSLTSIIVKLRNFSSQTRTIIPEVWTDAGGSPGSLVNAFDNAIAAPGNVTSVTNFTATDPGISVAANTTYWLVLRNGSPAGSVIIEQVSGQTLDSGSLFAPVAATTMKVSSDSGGAWNDSSAETPFYQMRGIVSAPEIVVEYPAGTSVADGALTIDLGTVEIGGTPGHAEFIIRNTGTAPLVFDSTTTTGTGAFYFSIDTSELPAGESRTAIVETDYFNNRTGPHALTLHLNSNDADEGSFEIHLVANAMAMNTPPVLNLPASPIVVEATSAAGATVSFAVTATDAEDDPDPTPMVNPPSGSTFPLGSTTVNASVTDSGGATASGSFAVNVVDTTPPSVAEHAPVNAVATSAAGAVVTYAPSAASDAVGVTSLTYSQNSGTLFPVGTTTVTVTAKDAAGNSGTRTFMVTVAEPPSPSFIAIDGDAFSLFEEAGVVNIPLIRTGGSSGTVSVLLTTVGGTAKAPGDFGHLANHLVSFGDGETSKNVEITINADTLSELNEVFNVQISAPAGGATLGAITTASVTIIEPDAVIPTVTLTTPAANAKINETSSAVTVTGGAKDNKGVFSVEISFNGGAFVNAPLTTAPGQTVSYEAEINPSPGVNTIVVRSYDYRENVSTELSRTFIYVVMRPLALTITPAAGGTVTFTPALVGGNAQVGTSYTLKATAKTGFFWNYWTAPGVSGAAAESATLVVTMTEGLAITANFIGNSFVAGGYTGLAKPDAGATPSLNNLGLFTGTLTATGSLSSKINFAGVNTSFTAIFDPATGDASGSVATLSYNLHLDLSGDTDKITGTLTQTASGDVSTVDADRDVFDTTHKVPDRFLKPGDNTKNGVYTVIFPPADAELAGLTESEFPQGCGIGVINISPVGAVSITGTLADGTTIPTFSAPLSKTFAWPLAIIIKPTATTGMTLAGMVQFDTTLDDSDVTASDLQWFRPARATATHYPAGWPAGLPSSLTGAQFVVQSGSAALPGLPATNPTGNAKVEFSEGLLATPIEKAFNLSTANAVTKIPTTDTTYTLTVAGTSGAIGGSFTYPGSTTKPTIKGTILQKGANKGGYGFFLSPVSAGGTGGSGAITIFPR